MSAFPLLDAFVKYWWILLVRGVLSVLFGCMAFVWPGPTLIALVLLYGAYAVVDGVTALAVGMFARAGWLVFSAVFGIAVGIGAVLYPGITAIALFYLIAAWAVVRGFLEIITAIQLRKELDGEWALILGGILSIGVGVLLATYPVPGVVALVWVIGAYALIFGMVMIVLAFRLRGLPGRLEMHERTT